MSLRSTNIQLYPSAFRGKDGNGHVFNPNSRFNTEDNVTRPYVVMSTFDCNDNSSNYNKASGSFVITSNYTLSSAAHNSFEFVIYGYYFKILDASVVFDTEHQDWYAHIITRDRNNANNSSNDQMTAVSLMGIGDKTGSSYATTDLLDNITTGSTESNFNGLIIDNTKGDAEDGYTASLCLLKNGKVPESSILKYCLEDLYGGIVDTNGPRNAAEELKIKNEHLQKQLWYVITNNNSKDIVKVESTTSSTNVNDVSYTTTVAANVANLSGDKTTLTAKANSYEITAKHGVVNEILKLDSNGIVLNHKNWDSYLQLIDSNVNISSKDNINIKAGTAINLGKELGSGYVPTGAADLYTKLNVHGPMPVTGDTADVQFDTVPYFNNNLIIRSPDSRKSNTAVNAITKWYDRTASLILSAEATSSNNKTATQQAYIMLKHQQYDQAMAFPNNWYSYLTFGNKLLESTGSSAIKEILNLNLISGISTFKYDLVVNDSTNPSNNIAEFTSSGVKINKSLLFPAASSIYFGDSVGQYKNIISSNANNITISNGTSNGIVISNGSIALFSDSSSNKFQFNSGGTATFQGALTVNAQVTANSFYATSDKRLKENITSYKCNKSILDLDVKKYDYINGNKNQIGCLAQDLQEICPELVTEDQNGYLAVNDSKVVYLLLNEVKELKAKLNELERKGNQ